MKVVNRPLVDVNGFDVFTGEYVGKIELCEVTQEQFFKTKKDFETKERNLEGKLYIAGLGWVK